VRVEDEEASAQIARLFTRRGVTVRTGVKVVKVSPGKGSVAVDVDAEGKRETLTAAQVLMAVGRGARTKGLGSSPPGGMERDRQGLPHGNLVRGSTPLATWRQQLLALGDGRGVVAAGRSRAISASGDYGNVPSCTYCRPQVASIGRRKPREGREVSVGRFPFTANGKAVALGETEGFLKVVGDKATGEIVGVHIVGPEATELIHEFAVGRTLEATLEEIIHTIHAHPTLSEAALEATLAALGQASYSSEGGCPANLPRKGRAVKPLERGPSRRFCQNFRLSIG
jgi:dihydrolipoamide dehydrogenase